MKILTFFSRFAIFGLLLGVAAFPVLAAVPTLSLAPLSSGAVTVSVQGDANSAVVLSYYGPYSAAVPTSLGTIGSTDSNGFYSATLSQTVYGIPMGSSVFVTVNNQRSAVLVWPWQGGGQYAPYGGYPYPYYSGVPQYSFAPLSLSQSSLSLGMGETRSVSVYSPVQQNFTIQSNSNSSVATAYVSGSQVNITGISNGQTNITLCANGGSCASLSVSVNGQYQYYTPYTNMPQYQYPYYNPGYNYSYNQYPYNNTYPYSYVQPYSYSTPVSFDRSEVSVMAGQTQTVTMFGGTQGSFYVSSNSPSNIASATVSGNMLYVSGLSAGVSTVTVCGASFGQCASITVRVQNQSWWNPYSYTGNSWMYPWNWY